jgi:hypothetical protein
VNRWPVRISRDYRQHRDDGELADHEDNDSRPMQDKPMMDSNVPAMLLLHSRPCIDRLDFHLV